MDQRVRFIVPPGLSREDSAAWLLDAVAAARAAAGHRAAEDVDAAVGEDEAGDDDA